MGDGLRPGDLPGIDEVLADPAASYWLKTALRSALVSRSGRRRERFRDSGSTVERTVRPNPV